MSGQLRHVVTQDPAQRMQTAWGPSYNRARTAHLRFTRDRDERYYTVQAWGPAFAETGGGGYQARLAAEADRIQGGIAKLREEWQREVIERGWADPETGRTVRPFVDDWRTGASVPQAVLRRVWLSLARSGHSLFRMLFHGPDAALAEITAQLTQALRAGPCVLTMESDDLYVPWGMLYTPPLDSDDLLRDQSSDPADDAWSLDGFWGYRHVVEHNFSRMPGFDSRIALPDDGRVAVGLNVDGRVDEEYPRTEFVGALPGIFEGCDRRSRVEVRGAKWELARALSSPDFGDHISYFGCHAEVGSTGYGRGSGAAGYGATQPYFVLGDDERIYVSDLMGWRPVDQLASSPLVFVAACQGGQLSSDFYPSFGRQLLDMGARCLVGPQIDLPRAFAREYTARFFTSFLDKGGRIGDITQALARDFAREHGNPLGLIFSLHRGMDVHLWSPNEESGAAH
ncbi:hypothetical protein LHJ74_06300 [Streptomyces sp. N2-109]|uniref:CHAT domain-containing protein n=1 Tax=Streptomyces gossypii TaxID=2883101 RepID=A0ABT2JNT0_9ACTN|nr:hypothetical protein [Streptomyces gossypii]MCT2589537.1 hypothetical protein [Streptomyces gossypii]